MTSLTTLYTTLLSTMNSIAFFVSIVAILPMPSMQDAGGTSPTSTAAFAEPPGSGWRSRLASLHKPPPMGTLAAGDDIDPATCVLTDRSECGGRTRCLRCPNRTWSDAVSSTGLLSVERFGARGDSATDDSEAFRAALNATRCCGGCVFVPPGVYLLNSTVMISGCVKGSAGGTVQTQSLATMPQSTLLVGPTDGGPAIAVIDQDDGVLLQDVAVRGGTMAILIRGGAAVRLVNVCELLVVRQQQTS